MTTNGGPAFPGRTYDAAGREVPFTGMTLRDYFAAQALTAVIGDWLNTGEIHQDPDIAEVIARDCYTVADAMLAARQSPFA